MNVTSRKNRHRLRDGASILDKVTGDMNGDYLCCEAHHGVCDAVCDETRDSVTELIMTSRGRWHRVSALISLISKRGWWTPSSSCVSVWVSTQVSKQFASNSLCLASVVAVEDWWLLLLIEYNIKCRQSMRVCIPVVRRLQCYTGHTKTRLTLITRTVQASLNAKWTYPLFIQPAIVRSIVSVCLILTQLVSIWSDLDCHVSSYFPCLPKLKLPEAWGGGAQASTLEIFTVTGQFVQ